MNNTIYGIDFTRALPEPLKNDENMLALGRAIAGELQENIHLSRLAIIYARIDELDENLLDILARDLHVDWYEDSYPVEVKRQVIKDSVKIHKRLGTKYAVVTAIGNIFPNSEVQEWYEYGGTHHRFRIILNTTDAKVPVDIKKIVKAVNSYKRLTAHLDEIIQRTLLKTEFYIDGGVYEQQKVQIAAVLPTPSLKSRAYIGGTIETVRRDRLYIQLAAPHPTSGIYTAAAVKTREKATITVMAKARNADCAALIGGGIETSQRERFCVEFATPHPISGVYTAAAEKTKERAYITVTVEARNADCAALIGAGIETSQRERFCVELAAPHPTSGIYATTTAKTKERVNIMFKTKVRNITSDLRYGNTVTTTERTVM